MKESILHYVWQNKLFTAYDLTTTVGETVEVIDVGRYNTDAGPDFFNAKVKISGTVWAGNIEIHSCSSDWKKHNHHADKAYDSVILHVVGEADEIVYRLDGEQIPQLILKYSAEIDLNFERLINEQKWIACADKIEKIPTVFINSWKSALLTERLEQKMNAIQKLLDDTSQHWEDAFYITLARNFGFGTNSQAFESLAKSLPLSVLGKHKDQLFQLEALLFGQSGLLEKDTTDEYSVKLMNEYHFLKAKFDLTPIDGSQWKLLRLRPDNFPHLRIAQFAALVHSSSKLFSKILDNPDIEYLQNLFLCEPSEYWKTHYLFSTESVSKTKKLGLQSIYGIIINTVVPFLFCYAYQKGNEDLKEKAVQLLENVPAERNSIISEWKNIGVMSDSAYDSQALIHLKKHYCDEKKCLHCRIGHKVLSL